GDARPGPAVDSQLGAGMLPFPIEADRLSHTYPGGVAALKPTSLQVQTGEVLGVVGQNGSGKTTLVKHFNGLLRPTTGRLLIAGADTAGRPVFELAKHVGYVFQNPNHQLFSTTVRAELQFLIRKAPRIGPFCISI